jgi:fumarate reductase flavoprotein subunit
MGITRRDFLLASGIGLAGNAIPNWADGLSNKKYDAIIIGAGTAGIPTAIFAALSGANVLVLEKTTALGGTLFVSTGQIAGSGTVFQKNAGIVDSANSHYDDVMRINGRTSDPALTRLTVDHAGSTINWLADHGFEIMEGHPVTGIGHDHFKIARYQQGIHSGISILNAFMPTFEYLVGKGKIHVLMEREVIELIQSSSGEVMGVISRDKFNNLQDHHATNTVLASGGCAANPRLFEELHNVPLYTQAAYPTSIGTGILLGLSAGGHIWGQEKYAALPGLVTTENKYPAPMRAFAPLNALTRKPWEILVNSDGNRFVREDHPSMNFLEHAILNQKGHRHWAVFDSAILNAATPIIPDWEAEKIKLEASNSSMFHSSDDLTSLAIKAGLNPRNLHRTVKKYNSDAASKTEDEYQRIFRPLPITKPPFYAIQMQGWTLVSFAGLEVNQKLQVIDSNKQPIRNLFALGEVIGAGATSGNSYVNGMLVTPAITFGKILGTSLFRLS